MVYYNLISNITEDGLCIIYLCMHTKIDYVQF